MYPHPCVWSFCVYPCVNVHQQCTNACVHGSERLNLLCGGEHTNVCSVCKHVLAWACASPRSHCALGLCWQLETLMTQVLSLGKSPSWDNNVASPTLDLSPCCTRADGDCSLAPTLEDSPVGNCPVARTAGIIALTDGSVVCLRRLLGLLCQDPGGHFPDQGAS